MMHAAHPTMTSFDRPARGFGIFRGGFTLTELLVVVAIVGLVVTLSVPVIRSMGRDSGVTSGVNTVVVAAEAARYLGTAAQAEFDPLSDKGSTEGAALMVTNFGEIRLLVHDGSASLAMSGRRKAFADAVDLKDQPRDYITLSSRTGIVGIQRDGTSAGVDGLRFVTPPFAIRFSAQGGIVVGDEAPGGEFNVYYDKDYDGIPGTTSRPNGYNPGAITPTSVWNRAAGKYELPFDEIEAVIGVLVFDLNEVAPRDLVANTGSSYIRAGSASGRKLLEMGTPVFFNRVTGAPVLRP